MKIGNVKFNAETNLQEVHLEIAVYLWAIASRVFWWGIIYGFGVASTRAYYLTHR